MYMFMFPEMTTRDVGLHTEQIKTDISYFAIFYYQNKLNLVGIPTKYYTWQWFHVFHV